MIHARDVFLSAKPTECYPPCYLRSDIRRLTVRGAGPRGRGNGILTGTAARDPHPTSANRPAGRTRTDFPRRYDSVAMQSRRARIIQQAQQMLAENGVEGFTINELSRRAGVAQQTLYNNLGHKEAIIGAAITEQHNLMLAALPPFNGENLAAFIDRASLISGCIAQLRSYASAMVGVFFSPSVDPGIQARLRALPSQSYGNLIETARAADIIRPLSDKEADLLTTHFEHLSYGLVSDWTAGRLTTEEYRDEAPTITLYALYPYLEPHARSEADRLIATFIQAGRIVPPIKAPVLEMADPTDDVAQGKTR